MPFRPSLISLATERDPVPLFHADLTLLMSMIVVVLPVDIARVVMDIVIEAHPAVATMKMIAVAIVLLQEPVAQLTTTLPHVAASRTLTAVITHPIHTSTVGGPHMIDLLHGITPQEILHMIMRDHAAVTSKYFHAEWQIGLQLLTFPPEYNCKRGYDAVFL